MDNRIGAQALRYWESRQAVAASNLANLSTPGFKAERLFAELLSDATLTPRATTDFSGGSLSPTARPLDVALVGEGFLTVETADGPRWARGGSLSQTDDGVLIDGGGRPVLGENGMLVLPPGAVEITQGGEVRVDGAMIDRLLLRRPTGTDVPERQGANLWIPTRETIPVGGGEVQVKQGYLEESNVDAVSAMVEMIEIQRAYQAVQHSMLTEDEARQVITAEIGRLG